MHVSTVHILLKNIANPFSSGWHHATLSVVIVIVILSKLELPTNSVNQYSLVEFPACVITWSHISQGVNEQPFGYNHSVGN
jgi:hypothetical protein